MVREEERVGDDVPGDVPGKIFVVEEDTHQLRDSKGRVSLYQGQRGVMSEVGRLTSLS